ncbi:MAG: DUF465 domain-containing protein [Rhodocyclaceae bacterium]|nr:DUF465 domain-containing protein [Rhodocyclaceae bacterium]MBK9625218.1 DUF465 domain-containing protein [Rhodocyclaceae bacterium]MBP6108868.1 DUF465 domain-containing protein [Rhodocyclaceae bacterium]MBP6279525.1 DUF465 domain-containing protein [Rhodocyclaceae bacterium]
MSANTPTDFPANPDTELRGTLAALRIEHRDLDDQIALLDAAPTDDELQLRRLKKRKLLIKDQIARIEHQLDPDEYA